MIQGKSVLGSKAFILLAMTVLLFSATSSANFIQTGPHNYLVNQPVDMLQDALQMCTRQNPISYDWCSIQGTKNVDFVLIVDRTSSMCDKLPKLMSTLKQFVNSVSQSSVQSQFAIVSVGGANKLMYPFQNAVNTLAALDSMTCDAACVTLNAPCIALATAQTQLQYIIDMTKSYSRNRNTIEAMILNFTNSVTTINTYPSLSGQFDAAVTFLTHVVNQISANNYKEILTMYANKFHETLHKNKCASCSRESSLEAIRMVIEDPYLLEKACVKGSCNLEWRTTAQKSVLLVTDEDSDLPENMGLRVAGQTSGFCAYPTETGSVSTGRSYCPMNALYEPIWIGKTATTTVTQNVGLLEDIPLILSTRTILNRTAAGIQLAQEFIDEVSDTATLLNDERVTVGILMDRKSIIANVTPQSYNEIDQLSAAVLQFGDFRFNQYDAEGYFDADATKKLLETNGLTRTLEYQILNKVQENFPQNSGWIQIFDVNIYSSGQATETDMQRLYTYFHACPSKNHNDSSDSGSSSGSHSDSGSSSGSHSDSGSSSGSHSDSGSSSGSHSSSSSGSHSNSHSSGSHSDSASSGSHSNHSSTSGAPSQGDSTNGGGLSGGAIAGIVVGSVAGAAIVLGAVAAFAAPAIANTMAAAQSGVVGASNTNPAYTPPDSTGGNPLGPESNTAPEPPAAI